MTAKELVALVNGTKCDSGIQPVLIEAAKQSGLVLVYGDDDDSIGFEGAIEYIDDNFAGGSLLVSPLGVSPDFDDIDSSEKDLLREYFRLEAAGSREIEADWAKGDYSWSYETEIPHETFDMLDEDGDLYCRGMVFAVADITALQPA